jgi:hypothetical protein
LQDKVIKRNLEAGPEKKGKRFALLLFKHRLLGYILLPYIVQKVTDKGYYKLSECLSPYPNTVTLGTLKDEEREVVKIINEYNDRALFKLFSKDKSVKDFLEKLTPDNLEIFIRPYIERRLYTCFAISRDENIPVYFQKTKAETLHSEDQLVIVRKSVV